MWGRFGFSSTAYENSALDLNAVAFSNGPMMDGPTAGEFLRKLLIQVGFWALALAVGFAVAATIASGGLALPVLFTALVAGAGGAAIGVLAEAIDILQRGCVPFSVVRGAKHGINDAGRGINGNHVWFGRAAGPDFPSFEVDGPGAAVPGASAPPKTPPANLTEVSAGLMPLVIKFVPRSNVPGTPNFNQGFANLEKKMGSVAWALIPLGGSIPSASFGQGEGPLTEHELQGVDLVMPDDLTPLTGAIMVIGHYSTAFNLQSAGLLASIGTRDAAAMDGSDSVMLGSEKQLFPIFPAGTISPSATGSPPFYKQYMQKYGFYAE